MIYFVKKTDKSKNKPNNKQLIFVFIVFLLSVFFVSQTCLARRGGRDVFIPPKKPYSEEKSKTKLKELEQRLQKEKKQQIELKQKAKSLDKELVSVKHQMVRAAKKVQEYEKDLSRLEEKLTKLENKQLKVAGDLEHRDLQMIQVLAVLENLALKPTEVLVAQPLSPVDTVRSAILLRSAVPEIEKSAKILRNDLNNLARLRAAVSSQYARIAVVARNLDNKHKELNSLFLRKKIIKSKFEQQSIKTSQRAKELAEKATDLRELLSKLEEDRKQQEAKIKERNLALRKKRLKKLGKKVAKSIKKMAKRKASISSFVKAKGTLPFPAVGNIIKKYGQKTKSGGHEKGITIKTRKNAQVIAPFDGKVLFSGPFRRYGQLLIIQHGNGYHSLLAGMSEIDVEEGQSLLAGEPVGIMGKVKEPKLYIEFRRNSQPINPTPWLAKLKGSKTG
jgi:septal ring factor EnvC (AmiA/AmiB activator)